MPLIKGIFSLFRRLSKVVCRRIDSGSLFGHLIHFHKGINLFLVCCCCKSASRELIVDDVRMIPTCSLLHHLTWFEIGRPRRLRVVWECCLVYLFLLCLFWFFPSCSCSFCFGLSFLFFFFLFLFLFSQCVFLWNWYGCYMFSCWSYCRSCNITEVGICNTLSKDKRCLTDTSHSCFHQSTSMSCF